MKPGQLESVGVDAASRARLEQLLNGFWFSQTLSTAACLGLPDALVEDGWSSDAELARSLALNPDALRRLMRALATIGVFEEDLERPGWWRHTPDSRLLCSDAAGDLAARARALGELAWRPWGELKTSVQTGRPAFESVFGRSFFAQLQAEPAMAQTFARTMASFTQATARAVADHAPKLPAGHRVVDVGGSHGSMLAALMRANPGVEGVLFDRPEIIGQAKPELEDLSPQLEGGDFFESVPAGADVYLLSWILHDWDDAQCAVILDKCVQAMKPGGQIWVVEMVVGPGAPLPAAYFDLEMLIQTGGRERSLRAFERIFADAGLHLERSVELPLPQRLLIASRAD